MPIRLYQLIKISSGKPIKGLYFSNKVEAKTKRKELNKEACCTYCMVSPGPDHRNYRE